MKKKAQGRIHSFGRQEELLANKQAIASYQNQPKQRSLAFGNSSASQPELVYHARMEISYATA
jgi:hypothetical protein